MVSDHRLHKAKIAIYFQALLSRILLSRNVSFYGRFALSIKYREVRSNTSNFPVFNASQRELTSLRVAPQIDDHWPWITLYFERNKR